MWLGGWCGCGWVGGVGVVGWVVWVWLGEWCGVIGLNWVWVCFVVRVWVAWLSVRVMAKVFVFLVACML